MRLVPLLPIYFASLICLSLVLALFEIVLEKDQGWASAANAHTWGRKVFTGGWLAKICEKQHLTVYHLTMFGVVLPAIFLAEYAAMRSPLVLGGWPKVLLFAASSWLLLCVLEDFLWFALNWYYPGSLKDLLSGRIWWHTRWWRIGSIMLPRFYVWCVVAGLVLLGIGLW